VLPQNPEAEQQAPKTLLAQVKVEAVPQEPSGDSFVPEQVPKVGWQPPPQCAVVLPQNPPSEQQSPNADPVQVNPNVPPHWPLGVCPPACGNANTVPAIDSRNIDTRLEYCIFIFEGWKGGREERGSEGDG